MTPKQLKRRFITIAVSALAVSVLLVTLVVNLVNAAYVFTEIRETAESLTGSSGRHGGQQHRGRESDYSDRWFTVEQDHVNLSNVASYTDDEAKAMAETVLASGRSSGVLEDCYYLVYESGSQKCVLFLNCETRFASLRSLGLISAVVCVCVILAACIPIVFFSRRAIEPFVENTARQKRFITDASHDLKTPLAVISANMDVLKMDVGESEWISGTKKQVGQMRRLVEDMVFLARADEPLSGQSAFDLAGCVRETAEAFLAAAELKGQTMEVDAPESLTVNGDEREIARLVSVLCDNAVKYAPDGDRIEVSLSAKGHYALIGTVNAAPAELDKAALTRMFDRFYRADASRSRDSGKSGFGIGLAIARAVSEKHGGDAKAFLEGDRLHIRCRIRL